MTDTERATVVRNLKNALWVLRAVDFKPDADIDTRPAYVVGYALGNVEATLITLGEDIAP